MKLYRGIRLGLLLMLVLIHSACSGSQGLSNNQTECGNGVLEPGEACDDGAANSDSSPDACRTDCTRARCGDGVPDGGEDCDGPELNGGSCTGLGYVAGVLRCSYDCSFDQSECVAAGCGNDIQDSGEQCDGPDLAGATCESLGFVSGSLACTPACGLDTSGCHGAEQCGDNVQAGGEDCDGADLGGQSCASLGFAVGTLICDSECQFDTTGCTQCGNDLVEGSEQCDGTDLAGETCVSLGYASGNLGCSGTCVFDESACQVGAFCGDGTVDATEQCDGVDLAGETCVSLGYTSGNLACASGCLFDAGGCVGAGICGNGIVDGGEACDGQSMGTWTCVSLGYRGGQVLCQTDCTLDLSDCQAHGSCGDGIRQSAYETCDGMDYGGLTCATFGFTGGSLTCAATCDQVQTGQCTICGDGIVNPGETCDDGANNSDTLPNACRTDCTLYTCGDGVVDNQGGEECDDANLASHDGCSSCCTVEMHDWVSLQPTSLPPGRSSHAMAYDTARDRVVLFGGYNSTDGVLGDTWEFDGVVWRERLTTIAPPARGRHAMVYDEVRGRVILFGGGDGDVLSYPSAMSDTWEWDGISWQRIHTVGNPSRRYDHAMVWDSNRGVAVMFHGASSQTWEYDAGSWTQIVTDYSPPSRRFITGLAFDSMRNQVLLFGGGEGFDERFDTWAYDGTDWAELSPHNSAAGRLHGQLVYHEAFDNVVLYGGSGYDDITDEWNGTDWSTTTAVLGSSRLNFALTYDRLRGQILLFGGYLFGYTNANFVYRWQSACPEEECTNGTDDDGDGLSDCEDADCAHLACSSPWHRCSGGLCVCAGGGAPEVDCDDGADNDCDGLIDCFDSDCTAVGTESRCSDGVDNDCDGLADCADPDCVGLPSEAVCDDGLDNDCDGLADCADSDCTSNGTEMSCDNGLDDDCDGLTDCADSDCDGSEYCRLGGECQASRSVTGGEIIEIGDCPNSQPGLFDPCFGSSPPDQGYCVFRYVAPTAGTISVTLSGLTLSEYDLALIGTHPSGGCDASSCLDTSLNPGSSNESLSYSVSAGDVVYIVVGERYFKEYAGNFSPADYGELTVTASTHTCNEAFDLNSVDLPYTALGAFQSEPVTTPPCSSWSYDFFNAAWFTYTPPVSGWYHVSARHSAGGGPSDSVLSILDDVACSPMGTDVFCQHISGTTSVDGDVYLNQGTSYLLIHGTRGDHCLNLDPTLNIQAHVMYPGDLCSSAIDLTGQSFPYELDGLFNNYVGRKPSSCAANPYNQFWFRYTPAVGGTRIFTATNQHGDLNTTQIAVFESASCEPLGTELACESAVDNSTVSAMVNTVAGTEYLIVMSTQNYTPFIVDPVISVTPP